MIKVVKYGAPWCGPCVMMDQIMDRAAENYPNVAFEKVDISKPENECFLVDYKIVAVPAIICFKDDKLVSKNTGAMTYQELSKIVENLLSNE